MQSLGINIGSSSVKIVMMDGSRIVWQETVPHEGDFGITAKGILSRRGVQPGIRTLVTGTEARHLFNVHGLLEALCIEAAVNAVAPGIDAMVSMGGEDLVVYTFDTDGKITGNFSGSKCASGTGEFFKQQLARMDMRLDQVNAISDEARVMPLSARCSVFMKSDCTHRLNKREADASDIVVSLSDVMATKVIDFLARARLSSGRVLLGGGVTRNRHIIRFMRRKAPEVGFLIPEEAPYFEAYGAALLAAESGSPLPEIDRLLKPGNVKFSRYESLTRWIDRVTYFEAETSRAEAGGEYILGIDGGSTTTKACLIDIETERIVASHYGRTHGDPVKALKGCLRSIREQVERDTGGKEIRIPLVATTGSSREILGVFTRTGGVYNEIIAHSVGTTYFDNGVDTIFEIGGQDAKYVLIKNKVPIDYAMNEACSAGTGSFLEESAAGDLNIQTAAEIGPVALKATTPLKFGEHCSAFINSDIRKAVQQGASREDITAGIVASIVSNYLNRVVGNRTIGNKIFLQGGVAKNSAVPLAFAMLLGKEILVPPSPELMGCFGVGLLAKRKHAEGLLPKAEFSLDDLIETEIEYERVFTCKACENLCAIQVLRVAGERHMFGGRCNKYANSRKLRASGAEAVDFVARRQELLFEECAPEPLKQGEGRGITVGIPRCFSVHTMYPLYATFFRELGIRTVLSDEIAHEGVARVESTYCFPAEIAHGAVFDIYKKGVDYIFLPHFRDMPSYEEDVHANFCPITQGLPYYISKAFPDIPEEMLLPQVVSFKFGTEKALEYFIATGERLAIPRVETERAFRAAYAKQQEYFRRASELGREALEFARHHDRPVIAILGRPYNAFTPEANMGIPKKFATRGYTIVPYDILPFDDQEIFPNMYWYYGQQDMKAAALLKDEPNIFTAFISNFSCAPDSFMLHYLKWGMGTKPFLILELDSHTADAGIDTRIEAFLDIIDGYRSEAIGRGAERYDNGLRFLNKGLSGLYVKNTATGEEIPVKDNPKVKLLLSNMGDKATELMAAILRGAGFAAEQMPTADSLTLQLARAHASGKECVPSHLVLGSALRFFASEKYHKDEIYLIFVPITTGPCRTGQYYVFLENLFRDLRLENVVVFTMSADNSYNEFGREFSKHVWHGLVITDFLKDIETAIRACAADPDSAMVRYAELWNEMISIAEERGVIKMVPALEEFAARVAEIPRARRLEECPRVLIVGEIYVRRDDFAVDELVELFSRKGIIGKISGIVEWVQYLNFVREYDLKKRLRLLPWWRRLFSRPAVDLAKLKVENIWKHAVENKIRRLMEKSGFLPEAPHHMHTIMKNTEKHFVNHELNSEISVSSGVAATAMDQGYSGIVNIAPFACLIGRVIEGLVTPWARERRYPVISVEIDGNLLPPNLISKLDIFMINVLRFRRNPELVQLMEPAVMDGNGHDHKEDDGKNHATTKIDDNHDSDGKILMATHGSSRSGATGTREQRPKVPEGAAK
jgi:predicted CoA-substrate-specific enzyme activase